MKLDLLELLDRMAGLRVLVVGDAILDSYVHGAAVGVCRESPVPAVDVGAVSDQCGGAANVASNVRALGATPVLLATVGSDDAGARLAAALGAADVPADELIVVPDRPTVIKTRVLAGEHMLLRMDDGGRTSPPSSVITALADRVHTLGVDCDAVIVTDHGNGMFGPVLLDALADVAARRVVVVDSVAPAVFRGIGAAAVKPNYREAIGVLDIPPVAGAARVAQLHDHSEKLFDATGAGIVAVTLDRDGAVVLEPGRPSVRTYSQAGARTTVGAGDTFTAALALALATGTDAGPAAEFASAAAGTAVLGTGTSVCVADELRRRLGGAGTVAAAALPAWLTERGRETVRVVFTNGCFDLLHSGHVALLSQAKALGDVLVVGVNDDASVRRLKGPGRPVVPLTDRTRMLAALSCVDVVVPFGGDSPTELIERLRPEVYVKGSDYAGRELPERALVECLGGTVELVPNVDGISTTRLIREISALPGTASRSGNDTGATVDGRAAAVRGTDQHAAGRP